MPKNPSNLHSLLDGLKKEGTQSSSSASSDKQDRKQKISSNPAVNLATGNSEKRAKSVKEPILHLEHDQVVIFKYHDRHNSSINSERVNSLRKSIIEEGQNFPGVVRKTEQRTSDGRLIYELIVGRLRFEASKELGVFKAFLRNLNDAEAAKLMFSENEDRYDITPFERWLSILPLVDDKVLEGKEIAKIIGWDAGNLARTMKARTVYDELSLSKYLIDVSLVKLNQLVKLGQLYKENPSKVRETVSFVAEASPTLKNNLFLKEVVSRVESSDEAQEKIANVAGSKLKVKLNGNKLIMTFDGLPSESNFDDVLSILKDLNALK